MSFRRVIAGFDGSPPAEDALALALRLLDRTTARSPSPASCPGAIGISERTSTAPVPDEIAFKVTLEVAVQDAERPKDVAAPFCSWTAAR